MAVGDITVLNGDYGATPTTFTPSGSNIFMMMGYGGKMECEVRETNGEVIFQLTSQNVNEIPYIQKICCSNAYPFTFDSNSGTATQQVSMVQVN